MPVMPYPMADGSVNTRHGLYLAVLVRCGARWCEPCSLRRWRRYVTPMDPGSAAVVREPDPNVRREVLVCVRIWKCRSELLLYSTAQRKDTSRSPRKPRAERRSWPQRDGSKFVSLIYGWNVTFFNANLQMQTQYVPQGH